MDQENKNKLGLVVSELIIEKLNITHVKAEDVDISIPLFSKENALQLDSIDGIEIVVALQQAFGVRINDEMPTREILLSIETIMEFLEKEGKTERIA